METAKIALFKGEKIRKTLFKNEWWFSVNDVIGALTDSNDPAQYFKRLKERDLELKSLSEKGGVQFVPPLMLPVKTAGVTPSEYKKLKGLKRENLRDHMDDFELIFNMLGERSTTEIHRTENSKGVLKLKQDANRGGKIAGIARKELEKEIGRSVVSKKNYIQKPQNKKLVG